MDPADITRNILMYFILPLWLAAGFLSMSPGRSY
jgi:hypothetical protein